MTRVLVLEDSSSLNHMMATALKLAGYDVASALSASSAFDQLAPCPDIIVLDLLMPDLDGPTFLSAVMSKGFSGPVVVASGADEGPEMARLISAEGFLRKPFLPDDLVRTVRRLTPPEGADGAEACA